MCTEKEKNFLSEMGNATADVNIVTRSVADDKRRN
jgi:hypothetical protein